MMAERGLSLDHSTIARWVLRYAPILSQRIRCEMRRPNRSWRVDETYVRVAGRWTYLYRAVDSEGNTIDFMLSPNSDLTAAKHFLQLALWRTREVWPRVINVDGWPSSVCSRHRGTEEQWRVGVALSMPTLSLFEQHRRAGPSFYQEAHRGEPLVPFGGGRTTDRCWLRGDARDTKGTNPMASQGRCCRPGPIHPANSRHCRLITGLAGSTATSQPCLRQILLEGYHWPGNIRELQNVIERAMIFCDSDTFFVEETWVQPEVQPRIGLQPSLINQERELIEAALAETRGRVSGPDGAARKLGVPRSTLEYKIESLRIDKNRYRVESRELSSKP